MRRLGCWMGLFLLAACGGGSSGPDQDSGAGADAMSGRCELGASCDDGKFCNGIEECDPSDPAANAVTHCVAGTHVVCDDGIVCTIDRCDESAQQCVAPAPDADGDGHEDAACLDDEDEPIGDDCDDSDATRFPGNTEVCTPGNANALLDEDCDNNSFGDLDADQDGHEHEDCCNPDASDEPQCGDDCDDDDLTVYPGAAELCDDQDNDCDDIDDESPRDAAWYRDADGDGFGDPEGTVVQSCAPVDGYSVIGTDCDDDEPTVNPGNSEACDGIDNNCNMRADEGLMCGACNPGCGVNADCVNDTSCVCRNGFSGDGFTCADIDECAAPDNGLCDSAPDACVNTVGGRVCVCPTGWMGSGTGDNGCTDFDECGDNNGGCGDPVRYRCTNHIGAEQTCADINECDINNGGCDTSPMATCTNRVGMSATCACPAGFIGNGQGASGCTDINECNGSPCGTSVCTNVPGDAYCSSTHYTWSVPDDGTVVDSNGTVAYMWQRVPLSTMGWRDAAAVCAASRVGGFSDWNVPYASALLTVISQEQDDPDYDDAAFGPLGDWLWTRGMGCSECGIAVSVSSGAEASWSASIGHSVLCMRTFVR